MKKLLTIVCTLALLAVASLTLSWGSVDRRSTRAEVNALTVTPLLMSEGEEATISVAGITADGKQTDLANVDDLVLSCSNPDAIKISKDDKKGSFFIQGLKYGAYTLTATGIVGDHEVSGSATITISYVMDDSRRNS